MQSPPRALQDQSFAGPIDSYAVTLCPMSALPTPLQSAVRKNAAANPLERAVAESLDLKPPEIYETRTGVNFFFY